MTEMVTSGSMSGERKRSDGLLGESDHERRRLRQAPPVLHATALLLDSTMARVGDVLHRVRDRSRSRRVQIVGSTPHPGDLFMRQAGRTLTAAGFGLLRDHRVLICDRDREWSRDARGY